MDLALFDFDGTITTHETFPGFMHVAVPRQRLMLGKLLLAPWVAGYRLGRVSGSRVRSMIVRFGLRGLCVDAYRKHGLAFADEALPSAVRAQALQRIRWHRERGDTVVVVSGALDAYLQPWCHAHGLDVICSALEERNGCLTGRFLGPQCVNAEKPRRVAARYDLSQYRAIHAYGDTCEDRHLLGIAHHAHYRWRPVARGDLRCVV